MTPHPSDKPFEDMTLDELRDERAYWDGRINNATRWGAAITAAMEFRRGCDAWIARREREAST